MKRARWLIIKTNKGLEGRANSIDAHWIDLSATLDAYKYALLLNNKEDENQVLILESLGLSITEIQEYFDNENNMANSS